MVRAQFVAASVIHRLVFVPVVLVPLAIAGVFPHLLLAFAIFDASLAAFLGAQGKTVFDPDFDIDDSGLPHEKVALPQD